MQEIWSVGAIQHHLREGGAVASSSFGRSGCGRHDAQCGVTRDRRKQLIPRGKYAIEQIANATNEVGDSGRRPATSSLPLYVRRSRKGTKRRAADPGTSSSGWAPWTGLIQRHKPLEASVRYRVEEWDTAGTLGRRMRITRIDHAVCHPDPTRGVVLGIDATTVAAFGDRRRGFARVCATGGPRTPGWQLHRSGVSLVGPTRWR